MEIEVRNPSKQEIISNSNTATSKIPVKMEQEVEKAQQTFKQAVMKYNLHFHGKRLLVDELTKTPEPPLAAKYRKILLDQVQEMINKEQSSLSYIQWGLVFLKNVFTKSKAPENLTVEIIEFITSPAFTSRVLQLPGCERAMEDLGIKKKMQDKTQLDAPAIEKLLNRLTFSEINAYFEENRLFVDPITFDKLDRTRVDFHPIDASGPLNRNTALEHIKASRQIVLHPFTREIVSDVSPAYHSSAEEASVTLDILQEIVSYIEKGNSDFVVPVIKKFLEDLRQSETVSNEERLQIINHLQNYISEIKGSLDENLKDIFQIVLTGLVLIGSRVALAGRDALIKDFEQLRQTNSFTTVFHSVYLKKLKETRQIALGQNDPSLTKVQAQLYGDYDLIKDNDPEIAEKVKKVEEILAKHTLLQLGSVPELVDGVVIEKIKQLKLISSDTNLSFLESDIQQLKLSN